MKKYLYKNIVIFWNNGWQADYKLPNGECFAVHRCCCTTKSASYKVAKDDICYMNRREIN